MKVTVSFLKSETDDYAKSKGWVSEFDRCVDMGTGQLWLIPSTLESKTYKIMGMVTADVKVTFASRELVKTDKA